MSPWKRAYSRVKSSLSSSGSPERSEISQISDKTPNFSEDAAHLKESLAEQAVNQHWFRYGSY